MCNSERVWSLVDAKKDHFTAMSDRIWETPEFAYCEFKSSAEQMRMLEGEGFRVTKGLCGINTAFTGEASEGDPVIARAKADLAERTAERPYHSPLPSDLKAPPHVSGRDRDRQEDLAEPVRKPA